VGVGAVVLTIVVCGCTGADTGAGTLSGQPGSGPEEAMPMPATVSPIPPVDNPAIPLDKLVGKWELREYLTEGGEVTSVHDDRARLLVFPSGRLIDQSICDQFDGDYVATDGTVRLENKRTGFMPACYSPIGSGRIWANGVQLTLEGSELTATSTAVLPEDTPGREPAVDFVRTLVFERTTTNPGIDHPRVTGGIYTDDLP
jgi:hypothetical protein